jgi:hypothetical protein
MPTNRALVVGVSNYPPDIGTLPGVAADVREISKLLSSKNGRFVRRDVQTLTDSKANRAAVLRALELTFQADPEDTLFAYLAGHGAVENGAFYFLSHDAVLGSLGKTAVSLKEVKRLFDNSPSRRAFLFLDCCHSGGIIARRAGATDDPQVIRRTIEVIQGEGKVIMAACTSAQFAYEDKGIGHGLFTHALLQGLLGKAASQGEVTAHSLHDFIDREIGSDRQRPMFFGQATGRIVLMHYGNRSGIATKKKPASATPTKSGGPKKSGTWIMLDDHFYLAESVRHQSGGKLELVVLPKDGDQEAELAALRPAQYGGRDSIPFAANNDAHVVRVDQVMTETKDGEQHWTLSLIVTDTGSSNPMTEVTANGVSPDEIARRRAGRILVNDPPPIQNRQGYSPDSLIEGLIEGSMGRFPVKECVVRSIYKQYGQSTNWKEFARLKSVFVLKTTGTVEHVLELSFGALRGRAVAVKFRGRRAQRYTNAPPVTIEINGKCPLD